MYSPPYDRLNPPEGMDHRDFGEPSEVVRLSGPDVSKEFAKKATRFSDFACPPSKVYGYAEFPKHLVACKARFYASYSKEINATVFMPDHAVLVNKGDRHILIEESLWHGNLFFIPWFRNDHTTSWKWLSKFDYVPDVEYKEPVNYCYQRFHTSYFHWFMDVLPQVWLLKKHSPYARGRKWFCGPITSAYKKESLRALGLSDDDLIQVDEGIVQFDNMAMAGFTFEEPLRTRPSFHNGIHHIGWSPAYLTEVRGAMQQHLGITRVKREKRYFVSRSDATHRNIINEAEVIAFLAQYGFEVIVPGELSFEDQVRTFSNADIIIGAHGAGLTNIFWSPGGASIIELMPERLADVGYRFMSNMLKQKHYVVSCKQFEHHFGDAYSDIEVDIDLLSKVVSDLR
jgi:hypothetical protein